MQVPIKGKYNNVIQGLNASLFCGMRQEPDYFEYEVSTDNLIPWTVIFFD